MSSYRVYRSAGRIVIESQTAPAGTPYTIYMIGGMQSASGHLDGKRTEIALPAGLYLVKIGREAAHKVQL